MNRRRYRLSGPLITLCLLCAIPAWADGKSDKPTPVKIVNSTPIPVTIANGEPDAGVLSQIVFDGVPLAPHPAMVTSGPLDVSGFSRMGILLKFDPELPAVPNVAIYIGPVNSAGDLIRLPSTSNFNGNVGSLIAVSAGGAFFLIHTPVFGPTLRIDIDGTTAPTSVSGSIYATR